MADPDLFDEEEGMVRMTFGEHLDDLRRRLILALFGVVPFTIVGLLIGGWLVDRMSRPVQNALMEFYSVRRAEKMKKLEEARKVGAAIKRDPILLHVHRDSLRKAIRETFPELSLPETREAAPPDAAASPSPNDAASTDGVPARADVVTMIVEVDHDELQNAAEDEYSRSAYFTLGPQEGFMAYLKVSIVAGIVMASWWIIYQLWQFVAEGLYQHERRVVYRAMPMSVGLFLIGVAFCFFIVLPVVLNFFFGINKWLGIEPNIRLSEWLGFATILPVIFGACFELPLVMLVLESVGIFRIEDYIGKWRHAILIISIVAMVVTPTTDPGSMMLLMGPMAGLYFLGIGFVQMRRGGLRALSSSAKLRATIGVFITLYLLGVSVGFAFPAGWLQKNWWLDNVWKPGTLPLSWLVRSQLDDPSANWLWGVTLGNAALFGLLALRLGEFLLGLGRRGPKK
jgi:sec-independent protein translocase protein TatC